ncbi:MAG: flagellar basal body rod protein FlgC [Candidatus Eisenbacteria bacterium]
MSGDLFGPMDISAAGLSAQRKRMETIARNLANAGTTRGDDGEIYARRRIEMTAGEDGSARPARRPVHRVSMARTSARHLQASEPRRAGGPGRAGTVEAREVADQDAGTIRVFDPHHPDADEQGYVEMPDINTVTEMVDMVAATRAYEANLAAMKAYQSMVNKSLEI